MDRSLDTSRPMTEFEGLQRQVSKLMKINAALMQRVEKSMDQQANAYSLFQTAIALEEQVRVRTEELKNALSNLERTNDELMSARDASERANRFKTRFFTAVGHDLLQPLHAARLSASALAETEREADHQRLANRIEHALTTIEDLLKSILDISKLEAGAMTPSLQPFSLEELFSSLAVDIGPMARSKGIDLTWRRNAFAVMSDPLMLRRILQNLLANAVQYTEQGAIMLAARRRGPDVRIEVWDTGPGIPETERQLIFEEFQRGPAANRPNIGGFGLGLSIVKRMADALGHPINFCSRVGHGTLFTVSAPFAATIDTRTMPNPGAGCGPPYGLAGAKVLIIDNDTTVLDAMQTLLERWSCEARAVPDLAALNSAVGEGFRPEIVLADYHLNRGQCGLDAVERLRAKVDPGLPVIVVTADHSPAIAEKARAAGCDILLKPVKPAELRALMVHILS
ncbi:MAG: hybrid sensor histidine kinase/response regulator [Hyphomicrobiaceae bacterium]